MNLLNKHRKIQLCPEGVRQPGAWVVVLALATSLFVITPLSHVRVDAQTTAPSSQEIFHLERVPVAGGAELITIQARLSGLNIENPDARVPLVTVLRDTLGDLDPENDRLRYIWSLTYTHPTLRQYLSGAVPFLYARIGNKNRTSARVPPPVMDLAAADRDVWDKIFWAALQNLLIDHYGSPLQASSRHYRRNVSDYRKSHVIRALSVLSLYEALDGTPAFSEAELAEIQARLMLSEKTFGGLIDNIHLERYSDKRLTATHDERGHNWELLRQRAEAESLYFEPLLMPDGSPTHAILWVSRSELAVRQGQRYSKRFLNIENPWADKRLKQWSGHTETFYFDSENRKVQPDSPGAKPVELIPLALYGLDNPKIPMLLVDFRDGLNPKKREMSRRALRDVTRNVLSFSSFGNVPYFLGRTVFDFVTGRRGMDINQPTRLRTYSQLKLLLTLDESLDPQFREEIGRRLEKVSLNPLENDLAIEAKLARDQYAALLAYANSPQGLPAKLARDRRAELVPLEHGKAERILFRLAHIVSFGKYTHLEAANPEVEARLSVARNLAYHTRFLRRVSKSSPPIEVVWNLEDVKRSLRYIAEHGSGGGSKAISVTGKIFGLTGDDETRRICLESLSRINSSKSRKELIRISQNKGLESRWKHLIASLLDNPHPVEPLTASGSKPVGNQTEQH